MGYSYYHIPRPNGVDMPRGYGIDCKCHQRHCPVEIDRGFAFLCYRCTWYYCGDHLTTVYCQHDEQVEFDCFAGESSQICKRCKSEVEKEMEKEPCAKSHGNDAWRN